MVIESSMSTNLHLRDCKRLISQCSLTSFSMLAILIVHMSTGFVEPAVPMESALLLGQALTLLGPGFFCCLRPGGGGGGGGRFDPAFWQQITFKPLTITIPCLLR